ncbi:MAG: hypothetical protein PWQ72_1926, partial [Pseudothermotoga sp.]|nr:hypothetical protein [Pseudothermotoga sp.]
RDINAAINLTNYVLSQEKVGQELSEIKPVDHALAAERKVNSSVTMG